jgi:hypothetical protein
MAAMMIVLKSVAKSESIPCNPILANMAVMAANRADKAAQYNQAAEEFSMRIPK